MFRSLLIVAVLMFGTTTPLGVAQATDAAYLMSDRVPTPREYARSASRSSRDYACLVSLWQRESNWNHKADNPKSSAYGIAQLLGETSKDPYKQIDKGLKYIKHRYGSACKAWAFWQKHGWY